MFSPLKNGNPNACLHRKGRHHVNRNQSYLLLVIATLFWGGNFIIGRLVLDQVPPFTLSLLRWVVAFLSLLPLTYRDLRQNWASYKPYGKNLLGMGMLGIALFTVLVYMAILHTSTVNAAILAACSPLMIVLFSYFLLGERISRGGMLGLGMSLVGVFWIVTKGEFSRLAEWEFHLGDLIMLGGNVIWALYAVLQKKTPIPVMSSFTLSVGIGLAFLLPGAVWEWMTQDIYLNSTFIWSSLLYLGICASVISFLSWNKAVQQLGPTTTSPFLNLIPLFATTFAVLWLGEPLLLSQSIGGMFILTGVMLTFLWPKLVKRANPSAKAVRTYESING